MFVFGTDGDTLRAWPVHTIKTLTYHPKGSGPSGGKPELAIHLNDGNISWLRGTEAIEVWKQVTVAGLGLKS